jgi:hypothetical protein
MKRMRALPALSVVLAVLAGARGARAHGEVETERREHPGGVSAAPDVVPEAGAPSEEPREEKVELAADLVVGFGKTPLAVQQAPQSFTTVPPYTAGSARSTSESVVLEGGYHILPQFAVGVVVPFSFATFSPPSEDSRGTSAFGNLEVSGAYELPTRRSTKVAFGLGVSLPTAQGSELPSADELAQQQGAAFTPAAYDRYAVNRAAALSRGYEENALFEPDRLGINPRVQVEWEARRLRLEGSVKLENLIATSTSLAHSYLGELVPGVRAGYALGPAAEVGVRVWANYAFAGSDDSSKLALVAEPQLVGTFGNLRPVLGVIVPFAGAPTDPWQFVGLRLSLLATF